jgi:glycosyltransferase involved in cell wall biosynthesis
MKTDIVSCSAAGLRHGLRKPASSPKRVGMRQTILIFINYYIPGYKCGGPTQSIANLVTHLSDHFDFRIITRDRDLGDTEPFKDVPADTWVEVDDAWVYYASPGTLTLRGISSLIRKTPHDCLYLNGVFGTVMTGIPLLTARLGITRNKPILLAPRGEFSQGALAIKPWKKRPYLLLNKKLGFYNGVTWHASSEHEANDIRKELGSGIAVSIAPVLPRRNISEESNLETRKPGDPLKIAFLARISPMKNLHFALEVLAETAVPVRFDIYGPREDEEYWMRCAVAIGRLPSHISVHCHGAVDPANVVQTLRSRDLLFLPTLGENFGHVIAEAFLAGIPVLISDRTPWRDLRSAGIGLDCSLNAKEKFADYIQELYSMSPSSFAQLKSKVAAFASAMSRNCQAIDDNKKMFTAVVEHGH